MFTVLDGNNWWIWMNQIKNGHNWQLTKELCSTSIMLVHIRIFDNSWEIIEVYLDDVASPIQSWPVHHLFQSLRNHLTSTDDDLSHVVQFFADKDWKFYKCENMKVPKKSSNKLKKYILLTFILFITNEFYFILLNRNYFPASPLYDYYIIKWVSSLNWHSFQ